jgi:hypothetical protein
MVDGFPEGLLVTVDGFGPGPPAACASPAADPERIAELKRQQQELDPFQLSRTIQAKCRLGGRRERRPDPLSP